jgi:protein ImuB
MHPLWLCLRLPSLPLDALPVQGDGPCVVFERTGPRKRLVCGNPAAVALGLTRGRELGEAAALAPHLQSVERNLRAEREALRVLAAMAYRFSSQVTVQAGAPAAEAHAVWLEIASSLRLFGGVAALCAQVRAALDALGHRAELGIAPTLEGACLLAGEKPAYDRAALWRALEPLPIARLPVDADTRAAFAGSGLRRIGEVLALPLDALARRFAPAFTDYLGRATGRLPDVRRGYRPPEHYRRRVEFAGEIDTTEALRFPIKRMLAELAAYLVARDTGVAAFTLELEHEGGTRTPLEVGLGSPSRDALHLQVLAHARLEQLRVPHPVQALVLRAERFAPVRVRQFDLFNARSSDEVEWESVLDRLRARLGVAAVQSLGLHADHRPEKSWLRAPAGVGAPHGRDSSSVGAGHVGAGHVGAGHARDSTAGKQRPLWLLPEPRALTSEPRCLQGPERIEGGWWDGADVQRDYYVAETGEGARLWVYREQRSGQWFLHGLWA